MCISLSLCALQINLVATALCYLISVITTSMPQANLIASLVFVFNMLFGGLLLTARNTVITIIMYFSVFNFGWQVLMANEFDDLCWLFTPSGTVEPSHNGERTAHMRFDVWLHPC